MNKRKERVLITGGAGFIGSHTADALVKKGYRIRILDNLMPPVHKNGKWPDYVRGKNYELIRGDVTNKATWQKALKGVQYVYHLAAFQDQMPEFSKFFSTNTLSTSFLYELLASGKFSVKKIIVVSTQFVYGDGQYKCIHGQKKVFYPELRTLSQFKKQKWEVLCPHGKRATFVPFQEDQKLMPTNSYGLSKIASENLALRLGKTYNIPTTIVRYSIVQGPRQSPYNLYSGALRIFTTQALTGGPIIVYEDGKQLRDFINIEDVVQANVLLLKDKRADFKIFNIGGGKGYSILEFSKIVQKIINPQARIVVPGLFRKTDTRHSVSDISRIKKLGWKPKNNPFKSVQDYGIWFKKNNFDTKKLIIPLSKLKKLGVVSDYK
ncbi:MAG: NAD-dependent epimerase/dehydratase family protein [Candidatus Paceibacterota bacterium]|jgi:dTDP-L-rhamnose 4-epimerase